MDGHGSVFFFSSIEFAVAENDYHYSPIGQVEKNCNTSYKELIV